MSHVFTYFTLIVANALKGLNIISIIIRPIISKLKLLLNLIVLLLILFIISTFLLFRVSKLIFIKLIVIITLTLTYFILFLLLILFFLFLFIGLFLYILLLSNFNKVRDSIINLNIIVSKSFILIRMVYLDIDFIFYAIVDRNYNTVLVRIITI